MRAVLLVLFLAAKLFGQHEGEPNRNQLNHGVTHEFRAECGKVESATINYLLSRGFAAYPCQGCPPTKGRFLMYLSGDHLIDAQGAEVGTMRMRGELASSKAPWWLWSSPLHTLIHVNLAPTDVGCSLRLLAMFESRHSMVAFIFPVGERLGVPSNGNLEAAYMEAIAKGFEPVK